MEKAKRYMVFLLVMAGCGGMLFDFGGTIIGPALPYIGPTDDNPGSLGLFTTEQVSHLSSAVVMCAAIACLAAGWLAERLGRKLMMLVSAAVAALACLPICLTTSFAAYAAFYSNDVQALTEQGLICRRPKGNEYTVSDDRYVLEFFYSHRNDSPEELIHAVMTNTEMWGMDLTTVAGFEEAAGRILKTIREEGALKAFGECLE